MQTDIQLQGFESEPFLERIGVRSRFLIPFAESFETLVQNYASRYMGLTSTAESRLDATLVDIGGPLNFKDQLGNFNTMSGPMKSDQVSQFIQLLEDEDDELPDVGLYVDIDYWITPQKQLKSVDILKTIRAFAQAAWTRSDQIQTLVFGG